MRGVLVHPVEEWFDIRAPIERVGEILFEPYELLCSLPTISSIARTDDPHVFEARCAGVTCHIRVRESTNQSLDCITTYRPRAYAGMATATRTDLRRLSPDMTRVTIRAEVYRPVWQPMSYLPMLPALQVHISRGAALLRDSCGECQ